MSVIHRPLGFLLSLLGACATAGAPEPAAPSADVAPAESDGAPVVAIPNGAQPTPEITTGGQPSAEHLQAAARQGIRTVISLRPLGEAGSEGEQQRVEELGMRFVSIPIAGAADLTEDNARKLAEALAADGALPAIVHCGSGNRAGALLALKAFLVDGESPAAALDLGKRAGLTKLEPAVRERLGL
ncbi:MAG: sulfur transferase domain-containing protein [Myxococcales bacterium]|nr:sulfur transferase domain-containing protein [Myxococcales bacterium]